MNSQSRISQAETQKLFFSILITIFCFIPLLVSPIKAQQYLNLDFESVNGAGKAKLWNLGNQGYDVRSDSIIKYSGKYSLCIKRVAEGTFGLANASFPVEVAKGKKLIFSGYIKTENITEGYAGLWWRVDRQNGVGGFDNMNGRGPTGTTDWEKYTIEMFVDSDAKNINFGVLLPGNGTAWFDNLQVTLDGIPYKQEEPVLFQPDETQIAWLRDNCIKLASTDPAASYEDLSQLKDIIGNARIVSLGEGTHGTSEFFKMKHKITKFLAENMGFNIFAIEANMPEATKVNDYILYGKGNPKEALSGMYFWTWNTQEVLDMIEWMRTFNAAGKGKIEFMGFDMQTPTVAMDNVKNFILTAEPTYIDSLNWLYNKVDSCFNTYYKKEKNYFLIKHWQEYAKTALYHLEKQLDNYLQKNRPEDVNWAIQNARIVLQGAEDLIPQGISRDESMAKNIEWILNNSKADAKIVLWAHNSHVSRASAPYKQMGSYLNSRYGKEMIVFGFGFHEGQYTARGKNGLGTYGTSSSGPGSFEWAFHKTSIPQMIIDLHKAKENTLESGWLKNEMDLRSIGALAMDDGFYPTKITDHFDAFIFFDHSSPSIILKDNIKERF